MTAKRAKIDIDIDIDTDTDIVVVGGGPAGAVAAKAAAEAEAGVKVLLIEEDSQAGRPVKCTGLISTCTLAEAGMDPGSRVILREITGAFIYGPDGREIAIGGGEIKAYVIDRAGFDRELLKQAAATGIQVKTGVRAVGLQRSGTTATSIGNRNTLRIRKNSAAEEQEIKAKVIIGADGPYSRIRTWAGLPPPQKMLYGIQAIAYYRPKREDFVEVLLGRNVAPNFFAWVVPASDGVARVGLATDEGKLARPYLERLLRSKGIGIKEILEFQGGTIPIGPAERTVADNILLVGDAAGQAKPTSGGGIYTGMVCAKIAGKLAAKAVIQGDFSLLAEYEARWRERLEGELRFGMLAHHILSKLTDSDLNRILAVIDDPEMLEVITEYGDIDYPSKLARQLIKRPGLWARLLPYLPQMLLRDILTVKTARNGEGAY